MGLWGTYMYHLGNTGQILLNGFAGTCFLAYIVVFTVYNPNKHFVALQMACAVGAYALIMTHASNQPKYNDALGAAAALMQMASMAGLLYEMVGDFLLLVISYRAVSCSC